jgi:hypothetical protein
VPAGVRGAVFAALVLVKRSRPCHDPGTKARSGPPEGKLKTLGARAEAMHVLLKADIVVRGHLTYWALV